MEIEKETIAEIKIKNDYYKRFVKVVTGFVTVYIEKGKPTYYVIQNKEPAE